MPSGESIQILRIRCCGWGGSWEEGLKAGERLWKSITKFERVIHTHTFNLCAKKLQQVVSVFRFFGAMEMEASEEGMFSVSFALFFWRLITRRCLLTFNWKLHFHCENIFSRTLDFLYCRVKSVCSFSVFSLLRKNEEFSTVREPSFNE